MNNYYTENNQELGFLLSQEVEQEYFQFVTLEEVIEREMDPHVENLSVAIYPTVWGSSGQALVLTEEQITCLHLSISHYMLR